MTILVTGVAGFIGYLLAAQAGARHSIDNPRAYTESNAIGFLDVLEGYNYGRMRRDFSSVDDVVEGLVPVAAGVERLVEWYRDYLTPRRRVVAV